METIITAATILATYMSLASQNSAKFAYNTFTDNGRVAKVEVLTNDNDNLSRTLQYRFRYDAAGRLAVKEALKWNPAKRAWAPSRRYAYTYGLRGYTVSMSRWDDEGGAYAPAAETAEYRSVADGVTAVDTYRRDPGSGRLEPADGMLVMQAPAAALHA